MIWTDVQPSKRAELLQRRDAGELVEDLAAEIGMRPSTLSRRLRGLSAKMNPKPQKIGRPKSEYKWNKPPVFKGNATVTGDLHMPYLDYDLAENLLRASEIILPEPRRLIIAGDLFNMDAFSPFPPTNVRRATFKEEVASAKNFLNAARNVFDTVEVLVGNHERRLIYITRGELSSSDLGLVVNVDDVNFHVYSWGILETESGPWRITHQKNYSRNAQSVGVKLAHKYRQHIITHHQHRISKGYDDSGKSVVIDNGCLADPEKLDYVNLVDSTTPVMNRGFTIVRNGSGTLFGKGDEFTDWDLLLS